MGDTICDNSFAILDAHSGQLLNYDFYPTTDGQLNKMGTINLLNHEM